MIAPMHFTYFHFTYLRYFELVQRCRATFQSWPSPSNSGYSRAKACSACSKMDGLYQLETSIFIHIDLIFSLFSLFGKMVQRDKMTHCHWAFQHNWINHFALTPVCQLGAVVAQWLACYPRVAGSILCSFSLSDETINRGPISMT